MPQSFDLFRDHDGGDAREIPSAGTVDPFDAVGMLGDLWLRMQLRRWRGQGRLNFVIPSI